MDTVGGGGMTQTPTAPKKGKAVALTRTPAQQRAIDKRAEEQQLAAAAKANAVQLAQIVNLHIAGFSLAEIGAQIGATADEVDRMIQSDAARYVRNQPALRTYVRNWISSKYMTMIEANWDIAKDKNHVARLENQDRVDRFLRSMAKLHGADAPVQSEVKVDAAPEAVERLVNALAGAQGLGYDEDIFDADVVEDAVSQSADAVEVSGNAVEESDGHDEF